MFRDDNITKLDIAKVMLYFLVSSENKNFAGQICHQLNLTKRPVQKKKTIKYKSFLYS